MIDYWHDSEHTYNNESTRASMGGVGGMDALYLYVFPVHRPHIH